MNKKALVFRTVAFIILVLALIVVGFNILGILRDAGIISPGSFLDDYGNFTPYHLAPETSAEATVQDSVNALICAINAVSVLDDVPTAVLTGGSYESYINSRMNQGFWETNCPEGQYIEFSEEEITEVRGSKCYEKFGVCVVKADEDKAHFEEGDYDENDDSTCPRTRPNCELQCKYTWGRSCEPTSSEKKICYGDYGRYCMASGYWCQMFCPFAWAGEGCSVENDNVYCLSGDDEIDYDTEIEENIEEYAAQLRTGYDVAAGCNKGVLFGASCVKCEAAESNFKCTVNNFNMPQTGAGDRGTLDRWIAGFGDPEYILYYEKFPVGEDEYWKADAWSFSPVIMVGSAAAAALFPLGDEIKDAIRTEKVAEALKLAAKENLLYKTITGGYSLLSKLKNIGRWFSKETYEGIIKKKAMRTVLLTSEELFLDVHTIDDKMEIISKHISNGRWKNSRFGEEQLWDDLVPVFKRDIDNYDYFGEGTIKSKLDNQIEQRMDNLRRSYPDFNENKLRERAKEELAQSMASDFVNNDVTQILGITNKEALQATARKQATLDGMTSIIKSMFDDSGEINKKAFQEFLQKHGKNADALEVLIDSKYLTLDQSRKLLQHLDDVAVDIPLNRQVILNRKIYQGEIDTITGIIDENAQLCGFLGSGCKNVIDQTAERMSKIYAGAKRVPFVGKGIGIPELAVKLGAAPFSSPERRVFTWLALSYFGTMHDSVNQKFFPAGKDTLVITTPSLLATKSEFDLTNADEYAIVLKDDGDRPQRFHLASPCKANLDVFPSTVIAKLDETSINRYDLYDFGYGYTPVEKGSIEYDEIEMDYAEKNYPAGERLIQEAELASDQGNYGEALEKYIEYVETYPDSTKFEEISIKIDDILTNVDMIKSIGKDELRRIAFEDRVSVNDRARIYSTAIELIEHYSERCGSSQGYLQEIDWCEGQLIGNWNDRGGSYSYGDYSYWKPIFVKDSGYTDNPLYDWTDFDYELYYSMVNSKYDEIRTKYSTALLFIDEKTEWYVHRTNEIWIMEANDQNLNPEMGLLELYQWISTNFNTEIADNIAVYGYTAEPWISPYDYTLGKFPIPKHLLVRKDIYLDKTVSWLPSFDEFDNEIVQYNKATSNIRSGSYQNLLRAKHFYELKSSYAERYNSLSMDESDIEDWVTVTKKLQENHDDRITEDNAVKLIDVDDAIDPVDSYLDSSWYRFRSISIDPIMDSETDTNYCYHGYHPGQEAVKGIVTAAGFFADEIAGAAAGAACASTGVGITVSGLCARSAMFVTNLGVGILENALNKVDKWPKH